MHFSKLSSFPMDAGSNRTKFPALWLAACGLVMGMLLALLILRPAGPGTMLLILIAIMLWGVSGLYFGERTFFAMR